MAKSKLSRREFIRFAGLATGSAVLAACAPQVVTQVVKETQIVNQTQQVVQTQVVEQTSVVVVTATPEPAIMTPQGRELPADAAPLDKQVTHGQDSERRFADGSRDIYTALGINAITEPLLRNDENIQLVPALAESWRVVDDTYWEFVIREGAVWSDGTPITAADIAFTYAHAGDPALANPWISFLFTIKGLQAYALGTGSAEDIGVTAIDDRTVQYEGEFGLTPYLPQLLAYQAAVYAPKHLAEADPEHWADTVEGAISSGPYILTEWDHGVQVTFDINPMYNGFHKPGIQKIVNVIVPAGTDIYNAWLNQEVEIISGLTPQQLAAARADPRLNALIHFFPNFQSTYLSIDTFAEPTNNLDFRSALAHAIDRNTLCQQILGGTYVAGHEMLPPGFPAYTDENKAAQEFNLEAAAASLAASGVDPATVELTISANGVDQFLEFVQNQWITNLGIKVNLVNNAATWGQDRADHTMQVFRTSYEYDFVDPSNMLTGLFRSIPAPEGKSEPWGSVRHKWKSDEYDQLVNDADAEPDVEKRLQMYRDAEKILVTDVGMIFLGHQIIFQIWWPWITGIHADQFGNVVYRWLDISYTQMYIHKDVDAMKASYA